MSETVVIQSGLRSNGNYGEDFRVRVHEGRGHIGRNLQTANVGTRGRIRYRNPACNSDLRAVELVRREDIRSCVGGVIPRPAQGGSESARASSIAAV